MFSKTDTFTPDEIALAKTLNTPYRQRVILWSRDELEPYHVYERSKDKLGQVCVCDYPHRHGSCDGPIMVG